MSAGSSFLYSLVHRSHCTPALCGCLQAASLPDLLEQARFLQSSECEMAEWRVDAYDGWRDFQAILNALGQIRTVLSRPLLLTFLDAGWGGHDAIFPEDLTRLLKLVCKEHAAACISVPLSLSAEQIHDILACAKEENTGVILTWRDAWSTPDREKLQSVLQEMDQYETDLLHIACMPRSAAEVTEFLNSVCTLRPLLKTPLCAASLSFRGFISSLGAEAFGSPVCFAGDLSASLQPDAIAQSLQTLHQAMQPNR